MFLLICIILTLFICYTTWNLSYWHRHGIHGPNGIPIFGNMFKFFTGQQHFGDFYENIYDDYPNMEYIGIYRLFNEPAVILRSQDMIKEIMIKNFHHFQNNVLWINYRRDPIVSYNPFIAKGDKWKNLRAEIMPIFTPNKVKMSFPHIESTCRKLEKYVEENMEENSFEAKDLFSKFTLDVVASAAYSLDAQSFSNTNSDFTQLVENLFMPRGLSLIETIALLFSPTLGHLIKYHYVPQTVQKWLRTIIGNVLEKRLNNFDNTDKSDFIQWLIEAKQKQNTPINSDVIVGHCSTFLLEGFETSSSLMAFALYEFATHPEVQDLIVEEIDKVLAKYDGKLSYEAIQEMTYLEASLLETLRLYPPMMALLKHCTKPFMLPPQTSGGNSFMVPEGMVFVVPVKAIHNDPILYPEPEKFQPERFIAQNEKQRLGCSFLGFGEGPRMCPGMRFGLAQSKAGIITLLTKYRVQLSKRMKTPIKISTTTFLTAAKDGVWISFKSRN